MKLVQFNREMRPHGIGDKRAVPDEVATRLVSEGAATVVPSVFDAPTAAAPEPKKPARERSTRRLL